MSSKFSNIPGSSFRGSMPGHATLGLEEAYILGYNVERLRKLSNMDIAKFAQVAGIARPTIYKIERGESDLKLSYIRKLADALGVTVVDLLTPPPDPTEQAICRGRRFEWVDECKESGARR